MIFVGKLRQSENFQRNLRAKPIRYLDENIGALDVSLTAHDLAVLDQAFVPTAVAGTRYPESDVRIVSGRGLAGEPHLGEAGPRLSPANACWLNLISCANRATPRR